jgi:hypothetical protein
MSRKISIEAGNVSAVAELNETTTATKIWQSLPIKGRANLWGQEIYFAIPLSMKLENGQESVNLGDLGYWPQGRAFCIFFGPTPVSQGGEIRPASAVTVFGRVTGDASVFQQVPSGAEVTIDRAEAPA